MPEEADLSAVGVTAQDKVDGAPFQESPVLRMMGEKDLITRLFFKVSEPFCIRKRGFLPVTDFTQGVAFFFLSPEALVIRINSGRKASDAYSVSADPAIVEYGSSALFDHGQIFLIQHPFMIPGGEKGRGFCSTGGKKWNHALSGRTSVLRRGAVQNVAGNGNQVHRIKVG